MTVGYRRVSGGLFRPPPPPYFGTYSVLQTLILGRIPSSKKFVFCPPPRALKKWYSVLRTDFRRYSVLRPPRYPHIAATMIHNDTRNNVLDVVWVLLKKRKKNICLIFVISIKILVILNKFRSDSSHQGWVFIILSLLCYFFTLTMSGNTVTSGSCICHCLTFSLHFAAYTRKKALRGSISYYLTWIIFYLKRIVRQMKGMAIWISRNNMMISKYH